MSRVRAGSSTWDLRSEFPDPAVLSARLGSSRAHLSFSLPGSKRALIERRHRFKGVSRASPVLGFCLPVPQGYAPPQQDLGKVGSQAQFRFCRTKACSGHGARPRQPEYRFSVSSGLCFPCPGGDREEGHTCSWVGPPSPWQHVARAESRGLSCRGQSLKLGGGLGTWSWQVRLGTLRVREVGRLEQGKVRHSQKEKKGSVCVPTGRVGSPTPIPVPHQPWPSLGPHVVLLNFRTCSVTR